jgi:hypothetical protein
MTTRTDIAYDLRRSPRIAEVASPSVELLVQDYVDTTRPFESSFEAMSHEFLISAGGKDDLGGGKLVDITLTEEDLKLSFEARTTAAETGQVTTGSVAPTPKGEITFTDTSADFTTASVERGSMVINFTDRSIADVVEVVSSDTLTTRTLVNGIDNTFAVSDFYQVFNVTQMIVQGGNVVGVDDLDATTNAILPTAFSQVVVTLSSSGTIAGLPDLEADIATILAQTTAAAQAAAVWDALISAHTVTGSFGEFVVRRLLTVAKFFSLRT